MALLLGPLWGSADPSLNEAPVSFQLVCPPDVTVDCDEDLSDLSKWGDAYVWKNYKKVSAGYPTVDDQRNSCGIGVITRTWRVEDPYWNWHTCTQTITVRGKGLFDESDITWPRSWTLDTCQANLHPGNLPLEYSYPRFNRKDCAKPAYSYKDEYFEFGPHCAKLVRTWSVIDWCQYKPYPGSTEGKWQHIQIIKVDQKTKPQFDCPKDTVFYAEECDSADIVLEDIIAISKCGDTLEVKNKSPYADEGGNNASGKYPIGVHEFYYVTEYGCGREAKCKFTIEVKPSKPPTPYCKNGIITTLMPMDTNSDGSIDIGMREVWASDLNVGSFHPCYPNADLIFSFSEDTSDQVIVFDCNNIGQNEVEMWVTDEFGNQAYCITYVVVQNNNPRLKDCMPDSLRTGTIAGHLSLPDGRGIEEVEVSLFGNDAGYSVTTYQDTIVGQNGQTKIVTRHDTSWYDLTKNQMASSGNYQFKELQRSRDYEVSASKLDGLLNGVDIWDYYTIYFHTLGLFRIHDPVTLIAADIDGNGAINHSDHSQLIAAMFDPADPRNQFDSWRFYDRTGFEQFKTSGGSMPQQLMQVADLDGRKMDVDFVGIKVGDLNGTVDPEGIGGSMNQTREEGYIGFNSVCHDNELILSFEEKVMAGQLQVHLPDDIRPLDGAVADGNVLIFSKGQGQYQVNWVSAGGSTELRLNLDRVIQEDEVLFDIAEGSYGYIQPDVARTLIHENPGMEEFRLIRAAPNPVYDQLNITFYSSKQDDYHLEVFNAGGQILRKVEIGSFDSGRSTVIIPVEDLPSGTAYYFRLTNSFATQVGSFIK